MKLYCKRIIRNTTDDLIIELNQENFKKQKKSIFEFAKVFGSYFTKRCFTNCIHYCLNNIYIEKYFSTYSR